MSSLSSSSWLPCFLLGHHAAERIENMKFGVRKSRDQIQNQQLNVFVAMS